MNVSDIMIRDVYVAHQNDTIRSVLERFTEYRISGMPIVDAGRRVLGYISDGDIMRHFGKHVQPEHHSFASLIGYYYGVSVNEDPTPTQPVASDTADLRRLVSQASQTRALDIAKKNVVTVGENTRLLDALQLLAKEEIKKVPVVQGEKLVGIVSRGDVVRAIVHKVLEM